MNKREANSNMEVVLKYLAALSERNIHAMMPLFAEDVHWNIPGNEAIAPWLGVRTGKNQVKKALELLWLNTKPLSATIEHIIADENVVICSGNFESLMLKTGNIFKSLFFIEIKIIDGLIVKYTLLEDSFGVAKALNH